MARSSSPKRPPASALPAASGAARSRRVLRWGLAAVAALALAAIAYIATEQSPQPSTAVVAAGPAPSAQAAATPAAYVGSVACASCHAAAAAAWQGSQHAASMLPANERTVLGDFSGARFAAGGGAATFTQRDGRYYVRTDGPDGKPADFEIKYTFGVAPLQQYLIELPGGRLQALGIAWATRPAGEGGQRWFHLYPDRRLKAGDPLHWTGIDQNWNYQCADCHSTDLRKNYDPASATFKTTWSEVNVGCEACHGPGSIHVAWAQRPAAQREPILNYGLTAALDERRGVGWAIDPASGSAQRSVARSTNREIEVCARCHARRGQFADGQAAGAPLHDAFRPALLEPGLYYPDGQQRDEVFNYGSFLQSRMHAKGVTCGDCHEPHSMALRAPGNAVCAQCHAPARFDVPAHHHHPAGSRGAECAACHMPTTTYMVVAPRHDHSMRIPRPDRTVALGVPNACGNCHRDRSAAWAAERMRHWYGTPKPGFQTFAEAFAAGERGAPDAARALAAVAGDPAQPPIVRASALLRLDRAAAAQTVPAALASLDAADANLRMAAVRALAQADPALRAQHLPPRLHDPVRVVRMDAARALAGAPEQRLSSAQRTAFAAALAEYEAAQRFNAERPEAQASLATLYAARGDAGAAEAAFRQALRLDPTYIEAAVGLADLYRALGRDADGEQVLRAALVAAPNSAAARHALGLVLVRQQRTPEAIAALREAARLAPESARFAFVYGVALYDSGRPTEAVAVLTESLRRHPDDRDTLEALAAYARAAGRGEAAQGYDARLRALAAAAGE